LNELTQSDSAANSSYPAQEPQKKHDPEPKKEPEGGLTVYRASAGSGKTYTLTLEYLKLALADASDSGKFREILAVTFTNKATDEMKARIINTLNDIVTETDFNMIESVCKELNIDKNVLKDRAKKVQRAILHNYSNFSISTIDKFFQRIIHVFVREAGLHPGFKLELDQNRLMDEAVDRMMLNLHKKEFLYRQMSNVIDEQMEKGSGWDVRKALKTQGSEVLKEHFREFGSQFHAKIRDTAFMERFAEMMNRIIHRFETKMSEIAAEAVKLIDDYGLQKSDFYYGENGAVNFFYKLLENNYDEPGKRVYNMLESAEDEAWLSKNASDAVRSNLMQIAGRLSQLLADAMDVYKKEYQQYCTALCIKKSMNLLNFFAEIETNIGEIANDENLMPISETTHLLGRLINESDTPFIYERAGTKYSTFMIDEFQDTSEAQWKNFMPLLKNSLSENAASLVVGDVKQSIYRWRNGDWRILASKIFQDFRNFSVKEKQLEVNWRSFPRIVEFNNALFSSLPNYIEKEFAAPSEDYKNILGAAYRDSVQKVAEKNSNKGGYVSVSAIMDTPEAKANEQILASLPTLIAEIQDRGYRASDIVVLVRKATDGQAVSDCLLNYKSASGDTLHCFDILSQDSLFIRESATVQFIISLFRAIINPDDKTNNASVNYFLNKTNRSFTWTDAGVLDENLRGVLSKMASLSLPEVFEHIIREFDLGNSPLDVAYIQELHDHLITFSNNEISDIFSFLEYWDNKPDLRLSEGQTPDAINIMTIHKAKGLEYPVVIVPFCNWQMKPFNDAVWVSPKTEPFSQLPFIPISYNKTMCNSLFSEDYYYETVQSLVDNLNLLYVTFTRAKEELYVMLPLPKKSANKDIDKLRNAAITLFHFFESEPDGFNNPMQQVGDNEYLYVSGEKQYKHETKKEELTGIAINEYRSSPFDKKLRLRYESTDYFATSAGSPSPAQLRNYGNLMHKIFSLIRSAKDVPAAIDRVTEDGLIAKDYIPELKKRIDNALNFISGYAADWFPENDEYEVITEKFLLLPSSMNKGMSRRPDRIVSSKNETVVVDYKFGLIMDNIYKTQVRTYMQILELMHYPAIKGYIWYVDMNVVEEL
jgi:ATP-dependent exoDNAse (exonuclease V) beta subunit